MSEKILQVVNLVVLAIFGVSGWRMVDEWRKSRDARHDLEIQMWKQQLESSRADMESLKATHKHELEECQRQINGLTDDKNRFSRGRDDLIDVLKSQIELLKGQAPKDVLANFKAAKELAANELAAYEGKLKESETASAAIRLKLEAELEAKDVFIAQLKETTSAASDIDCRIGLENVLASATVLRINAVSREEPAHHLSQASTPNLIRMLGNFDWHLRKGAAEELTTRGRFAVPELIKELDRGNGFADWILNLVGHFWGEQLQRWETSMNVLARIGDQAVEPLKSLSSKRAANVRAEAVLRQIQEQKVESATN